MTFKCGQSLRQLLSLLQAGSQRQLQHTYGRSVNLWNRANYRIGLNQPKNGKLVFLFHKHKVCLASYKCVVVLFLMFAFIFSSLFSPDVRTVPDFFVCENITTL